MISSKNAADIIIPVHNRYAYTRNLIEGIYRYTDVPFHIYLIDNASTDETVDLPKIYTRNITILRNHENRGWRGGINQGIAAGNNPNIVFLNNTVEASRDWLGNMLAFLDTHPKIGAVGPLNSITGDAHCIDSVRENLVAQIPRFRTEDLHERNRILRYHFNRAGILIDGMLGLFCMALKRRTVEKIGFLEEKGPEIGDNDYCRRLREAGYVLGLSLDTYVLHHSDSSARSFFEKTECLEGISSPSLQGDDSTGSQR
ncbi:MAG TPA: glycosyltransferase family 2 protein [Acidobacteriota bacterium]|nr:glycosyltransferase family 2 protein [Acidobacteriota bacterium]